MDFVPVMQSKKKMYARFLPISPDIKFWELYVTYSGYARVEPGGDSYPPLEERPEIPEIVSLNWEKGYSLFDEYTLMYITRGSGTFSSKQTGTIPVQAGSIILLFPGIWHHYRPDPKTGWDEHWIGFKGPYADRLMRALFDPAKPVLPVGFHEPLLSLFLNIEEMMGSQPDGWRHLVGAQTIEIIAQVHVLTQGRSDRSKNAENLIHQACCHLIDHMAETVDFKRLAKTLGVSYSTLRRLFKEQTGFAIAQYHLHLRMQKAEQLLHNTSIPVGKIAEQLGFESLYYFSRLYKQKQGVSPTESRKRAETKFDS
jgi:AraC-like DNA-binding protein